jgi:hypothetical protein
MSIHRRVALEWMRMMMPKLKRLNFKVSTISYLFLFANKLD